MFLQQYFQLENELDLLAWDQLNDSNLPEEDAQKELEEQHEEVMKFHNLGFISDDERDPVVSTSSKKRQSSQQGSIEADLRYVSLIFMVV